MLACGSACGSMEFLNPFPALPPAPEVSVDRSSFNELPIEERLEITQQNLRQVKEALRLRECDFEDLQHEMKFHAIKNEELMDVVNAFRSSSADRSHSIMKAKAEQNSELTLQVHALRDLLTKSGEEVASLQKQLKQKTAEGERLSVTKESHQRLQAKLDDLVKSLDNVGVDGTDVASEWSEWLNLKWMTTPNKDGEASQDQDEHSKMIETITRKMADMETDRQRLLKQTKLYSESDGEKEKTIRSLEREVRQIQHERDELKETNQTLEQQMTVREGKIGALEELFQNINANRALESTKPGIERSVSLMNLDDDEDDYEDVDIDASSQDGRSVTQTFEDMFVSIWSNFTGTAANTPQEETSDVSSCLADSQYDQKQVQEELARQEFEVLRATHQLLSEDFEAAKFQLSDLKARFDESVIKANSYKKKAELREKFLKDVIKQYKELQLEHSESQDEITQLKQQITTMTEVEKKREQEQRVVVVGSDTAKTIVVQEAPTFDMSERTERTMLHENEEGESAAAAFQGMDPNFVMEDYKRLEAECDRLQHEFDMAIDKIASLEVAIEDAKTEARESDSLQEGQAKKIQDLEQEKIILQKQISELEASLEDAKSQTKESQTLLAEQARKMEFLEGEKLALQERVIEATAKIVDKGQDDSKRKWEIEDELRLAQLREQQARQKQLNREQDLWTVIEQYKELAEQSEAAKAEKADEFAKLSQSLEEAIEKGTHLAADLEKARSEIKESGDHAKEIRKRMLDYHFHQKQVLDQQTEIAKTKILEREKQLWKVMEQNKDTDAIGIC